jgi:hypothetical protein
MAGFGIALRGLGKALKKLSKNKKLKDKTGLFSTGAVTGIVINEAGKHKKDKKKKFKGQNIYGPPRENKYPK